MASNAMWRRVAEDIAARIVDGTYPIGARLPTYEQLKDLYAPVSVGTIRKAVDVLRAHGVIQGESGVGLFVTALPPANLDPPDPITDLQDRTDDLEERQGYLEAVVQDLYAQLGLSQPGEDGDSHGRPARARRAAGA